MDDIQLWAGVSCTLPSNASVLLYPGALPGIPFRETPVPHTPGQAGGLAGFPKRRLAGELTLPYVEKFLTETCIAEVGHLAIGVLGFCSVGFAWLLPDPHPYIPLFVGFATLNLLIQLLFVIIQRYNRPRLMRLRSMLLDQAVS